MPFSNDQYREIRHFLDERLREAGLGSVADEAEGHLREMVVPDRDLRDATVIYFRNVLSAISRRSRHTYQKAVQIGSEFIRTETGRPISGFTLVAAGVDREFFGFDEVSLDQTPDLEVLKEQLEQVISDLEAE